MFLEKFARNWDVRYFLLREVAKVCDTMVEGRLSEVSSLPADLL